MLTPPCTSSPFSFNPAYLEAPSVSELCLFGPKSTFVTSLALSTAPFSHYITPSEAVIQYSHNSQKCADAGSALGRVSGPELKDVRDPEDFSHRSVANTARDKDSCTIGGRFIGA